MKKIFLFAIVFCTFLGFAQAQNMYWVFFTDKNNTTFDPYTYFDAKAIERYQVNHADLYDITNYPVNQEYENAVNAATTEFIGESRWLNAVAVTATEDQIALVRELPFVARVQEIASEASTTQAPVFTQTSALYPGMKQVSLMEGEKFQQKNINGKGVRIAVFDGGFPDVDTHPAFKHLRDNHQIIKTWNFANRKENVYGYNAHGRMVLSCIAGIMNDTTMLGLAPGAEFLLARTEVEAEKRKEEVWWVQALEWADQNGASIVSSSLGYGKELHNLKDMDGKTSIVAKGAATAASKGILVCTAMGNEGDEKEWKMLVTPADADGVLSVGAVNALDCRESYSSFGPTADGRRKPNVVACGHDMVAMGKGNYAFSQGTSFATPMVSGFAACVKQMHPEWTAKQLLEEIEKSANHYPYYDYAFGYGVPQAGYFTDGKQEEKAAFTMTEDEDYLYIIPVDSKNTGKLFYNIQNGDGTLDFYDVKRLGTSFLVDGHDLIDSNKVYFSIPKSMLENGQTVNMWYGNQYAQYVMGKDKVDAADTAITLGESIMHSDFRGCGSAAKPEKDIFKHRKKMYSYEFVLNTSFMLPAMWTPTGNIHTTDRVSRSLSFSFVNNWQVARVYGLGFRLGFGSSWYALRDYTDPQGSNMLIQPVLYPNPDEIIKKHNLKTTQFDLEFTQRFILANISKSQCYIEAGVFGDWITGSRLKTKTQLDKHTFTHVERRYYREGLNKLDCGVRLRVGFTNRCAIYGQYRITPILKNGIDLPKWEIGIQIL
ncbi:MAG: S8 family serine peptidase [Bacteroidales bacterium]|nr:S8 family serine peptidase [Bacteroidales bacterium]